MTPASPVIRKAVFPVGGMGTRFLPATLAIPKEMLPVVDKPLIQYAVEEAYAAGIREMIFVTGRHKRAIEDHFDTAFELESALRGGQQARATGRHTGHQTGRHGLRLRPSASAVRAGTCGVVRGIAGWGRAFRRFVGR